MKLRKYISKIKELYRAFPDRSDPHRYCTHAAMGLACEAGEVLDIFRESAYTGEVAENDKIEDELGDVLFYFMCLVHEYGFSLEDIAAKNIRKLKERNKNG